MVYVYHVQSIINGAQWAKIYKIQNNDRLVEHLPNLVELPKKSYSEVREVTRQGVNGVFEHYNPTNTPNNTKTLWLWERNFIRDMSWDPKQWTWRALSRAPKLKFFQYTVKRGYRIHLEDSKDVMWFKRALQDVGYTTQDQTNFFYRLWHQWKPRKIATMNWLTLAGGLRTGSWRKKIGCEGH
ncbi:hypothetical protein M758_UG312700 [Ceratodon purpureus]|nr:hypothetical protein M758_UG312700 [Ceratodon purpureus]